MKKGEIWLLEFPFRKGKEQSGLRPAIVLADVHKDLVTVIPLTSNMSALRFENTLEIKCSNENNLNADSVALVFQTQTIDKRRFINKIGKAENEHVKSIDDSLRKMFQL